MNDQTILLSDPVTVVVQIGNTDDKLTQAWWAMFISELKMSCLHAGALHFFGHAPAESAWQNCCAVVEATWGSMSELLEDLASLAKRYSQDNIAITAGTTQFVEAATE